MKKYYNFNDIVYVEYCCNLCNEVIHNHIDCPVCKTRFASTDAYYELLVDDEFRCENCKSRFRVFVNKDSDILVELIKIGDNFVY